MGIDVGSSGATCNNKHVDDARSQWLTWPVWPVFFLENIKHRAQIECHSAERSAGHFSGGMITTNYSIVNFTPVGWILLVQNVQTAHSDISIFSTCPVSASETVYVTVLFQSVHSSSNGRPANQFKDINTDMVNCFLGAVSNRSNTVPKQNVAWVSRHWTRWALG